MALPCGSGSCTVSHRAARHSPPDSWRPQVFPQCSPSSFRQCLHGPRKRRTQVEQALVGHLRHSVGPQLPTEYLAWHSPRLFHPESESLRRGGNGSSCLPPGGQQGLGSVLRLHHGDHPAQGQSRVARARCSGHADDCSRDTCPHPHGYIHHQGGGPRQGLARYLTLLQARPQAKVHFQED